MADKKYSELYHTLEKFDEFIGIIPEDLAKETKAKIQSLSREL